MTKKVCFTAVLLTAICSGIYAQEAVSDLTKQEKAATLDGVVVKGNRPKYVLKDGNTIIAIQNTVLANLNTAADVLANLSGITATDDTYSITGIGEAVIYIDYRKLHDNTTLQRIMACDIARVEIIRHPGSEYGATEKAIIRVYTIKHKDDGWGATAKTTGKQRKSPGYEALIQLNHRHGGLEVSASIDYEYYNLKPIKAAIYEISSLTPGRQWRLEDNAHFTNRKGMLNTEMSAVCELSPQHTVGVYYQYGRTPNGMMTTDDRYTMTLNGEQQDEIIHTATDRDRSTSHSANLFYTGQTGGWCIDFTADMIHGKQRTIQDVEETSVTTGTTTPITSQNYSHHNHYAAKITAKHPLWQGQLLFGANGTYTRRCDDSRNGQNVMPANNSKVNEKKGAVFAEYSKKLWEGANIKAGLRYEQARNDYYQNGKHTEEMSKTYSNLCPTLSWDITVGNWNYNASYRMATERPGFALLRSTLSYNNRLVYEGGNPALTPATVHFVQLQAQRRWLFAGLSYQHWHNPWAFETLDYESNPDAIVFGMANHKKSQYITADINLTPQIGRWHPDLYIEFTQPFFTIIQDGNKRNLNRGMFFVMLNNIIDLPHGWMLTMQGLWQSEGNFSATLSKEFAVLNASLNKTFCNGRLLTALSANDTFNSRHRNNELYATRINYTKSNSPDSRCIMLSITYRLNRQTKGYRNERASEADAKRL